MYDMIVIGAGPAGLSSAIYGLRAGKSVLVLEGKSYGGQIINTPKVENYPGIKEISGYHFATEMFEQAKKLGAEISYEKCTGIEKNFVVNTPEHSYECRSVVLAVGAVNRKLGLDREEELTGKGISYCATCDGAFFKGKDVAVVGGGNTALEDALFLSNYCRSVSVIHRRDTFRGEKKREMLLREKDNVHFYLEQRILSVAGEERLEELTMCHTVTGEEQKLSVDGLFIAVGQMPDTREFTSLIQLDEGGYIEAGEDCHTNIPGIYAAGDCRKKQVRQLTTAVADGSVAALAACAYCEANLS